MPPPDKTHPEAGFVELEPLVIGVVDLVFVIIAIAGLIVVCAGWVLGWLIQETFGRISILGYHPFGFVGNLLMDATGRIAHYLIQRVIAFAHGAWSLVSTIWRSLYVILSMFQWAVSYIDGSHQQLQAGLAALRAQETADIGNLRLKEQTDVNTIDAYVANAQTQITDNLITEKADFGTAQANAASYTDQKVAAEDRRVTNLDNTVTGIGTRVNTLDNTLNTVQTQLQTKADLATLDGDVNQLKAADATNLQAAENYATNLVSGLGLAGITSTLTALQGQVSKIATETTECLDPLCNTVTPNAKRLGNLGNLLHNLELLGLEALLVALAAECLTHPSAVVEDISSVVNAVGDPVLAAMRDVVGA